MRLRAEGKDGSGIVDEESISEIEGSIYGDLTVTRVRHNLSSVGVLPPVNSSNLVGIGLDYVDHARELAQPIPQESFIFIKAPSAIIGHEDAIMIAFPDHETHHDAELRVVIKHTAKNIKPEDALRYVLGCTCGNNVSDRTMQRIGGAPTRGKSLDTFGPIVPFIITPLNPDNLEIECLG